MHVQDWVDVEKGQLLRHRQNLRSFFLAIHVIYASFLHRWVVQEKKRPFDDGGVVNDEGGVGRDEVWVIGHHLVLN